MPSQLTADKLNNLRVRLSRGETYRKIASALRMSTSTVSKYAKQYFPERENSKAGRPTLFSKTTLTSVRRKVFSGELTTAVAVQEYLSDLGVSCTHKTVCNLMKKLGFESRIKIKKPLLSQKHIKARLEWAKAHQYWTVDDWKRVVWSDETKINVWGSDGVKYCWIKPGNPLKSHHLDLTVKHGKGNIMLWGCMTYEGLGYACQILDGTMKKEDYVGILKTTLQNTIDHYQINENVMIFQHDNDPKHTAKYTKEYLNSCRFSVLSWPAQSPDLNPIEHIWHHIKLKLSCYDRQASGVTELWTRVEDQWNAFPSELCKKYVESMPARVKAVLRAKGGHTRY